MFRKISIFLTLGAVGVNGLLDNGNKIQLTGTEVLNLLISQRHQRNQQNIEQEDISTSKQTDDVINAYSCVENEIAIPREEKV